MYHPFNGAQSLEEYEVLLRTEPIVADSEMIERGEWPLFQSVYDRLYGNVKRKKEPVKTDAEIVDEIFSKKLEKKKPAEKKKGLTSFKKTAPEKVEKFSKPVVTGTHQTEPEIFDNSFIVSLLQ